MLKFRSVPGVDEVGALIAKVATGWMAISVFGAAVALASQAFLARVLGVDEYGWYVLLLAWIQILVIPAVFGFDTAVLRFTSVYVAAKEWGALRGVLSFGLWFVVLLSILIILIVALSGEITNFGWPEDRFKTFKIALVLLPVLAVSSIAEQALRGLKRVLVSVVSVKLFRPAFLLAVVFTSTHLAQGIDDAGSALLVNFIGAFLAAAYMLGTTAYRLPREIYAVEQRIHARQWMAVAVPMVFMSGIYILLGKVDVVMLGQIFGASEAGIYSAASRLCGLVGFGLGAVNSISAPMLAEYYSSGDRERLESTLSWSAKIATVVTVLATLFLLVLGEWVLGLFGEDFVTGFSALLVLLVGACGSALAGSVGYMMVMAGKQALAAAIVGIALVVNVILNLLLIPRFGMFGAAIATTVSTILWNSVMYTYVKVKLKLNPSIFQFGKVSNE